MSKGNTFENDLLKAIFNATAITSLLINATSSPFTDLYVALHTADPGEAGDQTSSECNFTGYARVAVVRTSSGWTVTNNRVVNAADITFPACTAGSNVALWFSVGVAASGASKILYYGYLGAATSFQPILGTASDDKI